MKSDASAVEKVPAVEPEPAKPAPVKVTLGGYSPSFRASLGGYSPAFRASLGGYGPSFR